MKYPRQRFPRLVPILVLFAAGCASQQTNGTFLSAPLFGMIYGPTNRPCDGVVVVVDGKEVAVSDSQGRFLVSDLTRGSHRLTATKHGFETFDEIVDFNDETQVLYLRLVSLPELLAAAEDAIRSDEWARAEDALERSERIAAEDPVAEFIWAVLEYRRGSYQKAKERLLGLLAGGADDPTVYLLLADVYELHLGRPDLALAALKQALSLDNDPSVSERLSRLSKP